MDPVKDAASSLESKPAADNMPAATGAKMEAPTGPAANIAPGTEGFPHTGQIEPHSPAANALPNSGASGAVAQPQATTTTLSVGASPVADLGVRATSEMITDDTVLPKTQNPNDVKFKVKYGSYKGEKTFPEGSVQIVSKESAEHFTKIGIGSVIK